MIMLTLKMNKAKQDILISDIDALEKFIKSYMCSFKLLNNSSRELVKKELFDQDQVFLLKSFKKWISKNVFKSSFSNRTIDFWMNRGYSKEESKEIISKIQIKNTLKRSEKIAKIKSSGDDFKYMFNVFKEYYQKKGYSEEESKKMLSQRQRTFSLEKCILKYGEEVGNQRWKARQQKWQSTLSAKPEEEKKEIKMKRIVPLGQASKESLKIFEPITKYLVATRALCEDEIFYGYKDKREFYLSGENFYLYDFCIPKLNLIIEYQGKRFHPDYRFSEKEMELWSSPYNNETSYDARSKDEKKRQFAEKNGFKVEYLWASDGFEFNFNKAKNIIFGLLEEIAISRSICSIKEQIQVTDIVIDTPTGFNRVVNYVEKPSKQLYKIVLENNNSLTCSNDHLFKCSNSWVKAEDVFNEKHNYINSLLVDTRQGQSMLTAIEDLGIGSTVDITVECLDNHYYSGDFISHNCGKTLLAIAAGLEQLSEINPDGPYQKLVVSRPVQPVGRDIGFLPGSLQEKMEPWIAPIRDNLEYLLSNQSGKKGTARKKKLEESSGGPSGGITKDPYFQLLQQKGLIEVEAITFIRGRSIPNAFIIIDEAQNLSPHELKTIVTRAGEGTKIVLTGDIEQIDNIHVDTFTNGLTHAVEKFKEYDLSGHITLLRGERSELATLASKIL